MAKPKTIPIDQALAFMKRIVGGDALHQEWLLKEFLKEFSPEEHKEHLKAKHPEEYKSHLRDTDEPAFMDYMKEHENQEYRYLLKKKDVLAYENYVKQHDLEEYKSHVINTDRARFDREFPEKGKK